VPSRGARGRRMDPEGMLVAAEADLRRAEATLQAMRTLEHPAAIAGAERLVTDYRRFRDALRRAVEVQRALRRS